MDGDFSQIRTLYAIDVSITSLSYLSHVSGTAT